MNQTENRDLARELRQLWDFISEGVGNNYTAHSMATSSREQYEAYGRHTEDKVIADFMHRLPAVMAMVRQGEELKNLEKKRGERQKVGAYAHTG